MAVVAGLIAAMVLSAGCKPAKSSQPASPPVVEYVLVEQKDVPIHREWVGTLEGEVNATISAQVTGYLLHQRYTEGQAVKKGALLFEMDARLFQATLDQARAKLRKTELDVARYTPLAATEAISQQELDDAIQANLAAKAVVAEAELNVEFCRIRSPVDGVAGLARAQIGDLVGPGTGPLTTVVQVDPMRVYFSLAQETIIRIQERRLAEGQNLRQPSDGVPLELILPSGSVYPRKGRSRFGNNQVDVKTGTVRVVGEFDNSQGLLIPGMFARVRALVGTETNALVVPQRAVTETQGHHFVAVIGAEDKITIRPVETGERVGQQWLVQGRLQAGDRIVAEGIQKVREGAVVNPVPFVATNTVTAP